MNPFFGHFWSFLVFFWSFFGLFSDEIKVDTDDEPLQARVIAFSVWGILRGLESFSQLIYTNSQFPGMVNSHYFSKKLLTVQEKLNSGYAGSSLV